MKQWTVEDKIKP
ncbi:Protein of unknown function [Bacillus cytotoxicus]|nr:Protein of unknown function [Bacillus cytotoxicus]